MPDREIVKKYDDVRSSLENAIAVSDDMNVNGDEENAELSYIRKTLNQLNDDFKAEIERLEQSTEWDRFCMAFFGETNAGKSTIIDALRIVYDEETRREEINRQSEELNAEQAKEKTDYKELIDKIELLNNSLANQGESNSRYLIRNFVFGAIGIVVGFTLAFFLL